MARRLTRALAAALLFAGACASPVWAGAEADALKKGGELVQNGDLDGAVTLYRKAAEAWPKNAKLQLALGLALANKGEAIEASHHLKNSAEIEPTFQAWYSLGLVLANQNIFDRAVDAYRKAIELNPRAFKAWYQLGLVYQARGEFPAASEAFGNSVKYNPNYPEAYLGLGSAAYWSGDPAGARDQVARLRSLKFKEQAEALESWIDAKEKQKTAVTAPASQA